MAMRTMADVFATVGDVLLPDQLSHDEAAYDYNIKREALGLTVLGDSQSADTASMIEQLQTEMAILRQVLSFDIITSADEEMVIAHYLADTVSAVAHMQAGGSFAVAMAQTNMHTRRAIIAMSKVSVENRLFHRMSRPMIPANVRNDEDMFPRGLPLPVREVAFRQPPILTPSTSSNSGGVAGTVFASPSASVHTDCARRRVACHRMDHHRCLMSLCCLSHSLLLLQTLGRMAHSDRLYRLS